MFQLQIFNIYVYDNKGVGVFRCCVQSILITQILVLYQLIGNLGYVYFSVFTYYNCECFHVLKTTATKVLAHWNSVACPLTPICKALNLLSNGRWFDLWGLVLISPWGFIWDTVYTCSRSLIQCNSYAITSQILAEKLEFTG